MDIKKINRRSNREKARATKKTGRTIATVASLLTLIGMAADGVFGTLPGVLYGLALVVAEWVAIYFFSVSDEYWRPNK